MKRISLFTFFIFLGIAGCMAQASGEKIEKVYVAFKTHLDVGFTDPKGMCMILFRKP